MYPEFIAIYIGLAILSALMIVVLILLLKLLKQSEVKQIPRPYVPAENQTAAASDRRCPRRRGVLQALRNGV